MRKGIILILVIFLLVIPPLLSWWVADYLHLRPVDANMIIWLFTAYTIWIALVAGIFQIFGYDVKSLFVGEDGNRRIINKPSIDKSKPTQFDSIFLNFMLETSNTIYSPYTLIKILSTVIDKDMNNIPSIQERLQMNRFILRERVNKICEIGLVSLIEDDLMITEQGKVVYSFLSSRIHH